MKQINIPLVLTQPITQTVYMPAVTLKGQSTVNFILTGISEDVNNVLFLDINWGDGSEVVTLRKDAVYDYRVNTIFYEILYGKLAGSVCTIQPHVYINKDISSYGISLSASFRFYYDNGAIGTVYQPIVIYWGSFYDEIKELVAINTQIQPISTNRTFVNLESKQYTQILPCLLDITGIPQIALPDVEAF